MTVLHSEFHVPRTHALQARPGSATILQVRLPDQDRARLERMARREPQRTTVSDVVRQAIQSHLLLSSGRSPFFQIFGHLIEDLADLQIRPILTGMWAAGAHGYLGPAEPFELLIRKADVGPLRRFLRARGLPNPSRSFPFIVGRRPWCVRFDVAYGGVTADKVPTETFSWETTSLEVLALDALIELGNASLPDYVIDGLQAIKDGTFHLDDGERGAVALDAVGRFTASAAYQDPKTHAPYRFIDFRRATPS